MLIQLAFACADCAHREPAPADCAAASHAGQAAVRPAAACAAFHAGSIALAAWLWSSTACASDYVFASMAPSLTKYAHCAGRRTPCSGCSPRRHSRMLWGWPLMRPPTSRYLLSLSRMVCTRSYACVKECVLRRSSAFISQLLSYCACYMLVLWTYLRHVWWPCMSLHCHIRTCMSACTFAYSLACADTCSTCPRRMLLKICLRP